MNLWSNKKAVCNCGWRKKPKKKKKPRERNLNVTALRLASLSTLLQFFFLLSFSFFPSLIHRLSAFKCKARFPGPSSDTGVFLGLGWKHSPLHGVQATCFIYMQSLPSRSLFFFFTWHCILQKTVNTVRHRKQVDNNESDCGKSVCTQD